MVNDKTHDDGDRADGDQAEMSTAVYLMGLAVLLIFGIGIVWLFIANWEEVFEEATEAYDAFEEHVEPAVEELLEPAVEALREALVDCEKLEAEHIADLRCALDDNCMMTRDESVRSRERQDALKKYCSE